MYSIIDGEFWHEYGELSRDSKLLYIFLFSNPARSNIGVYVLNRSYIMALLGFTKDEINNCLIELSNVKLIVFDEKYIFIRGLFKRQPMGYKHFLRYKKELEKIDSEKIRSAFMEKYSEKIENEPEYYVSRPKKETQETREPKKEKVETPLFEDPKEQIIDNVIKYLNEVTKSNFQLKNKEARKLISGRLSEGYSFEQFKQVIDKKWNEWKGTDYEKFVKPTTLFRPSHFDDYLNQKTNVLKGFRKPTVYEMTIGKYQDTGKPIPQFVIDEIRKEASQTNSEDSENEFK